MDCLRKNRRLPGLPAGHWLGVLVLAGLSCWASSAWGISVDGVIDPQEPPVAQSDIGDLGLPGDVNVDGFVGGDDLNTVITWWGRSGMDRQHGDLTGDGFVGAGDYAEVLTNWGTSSPSPAHAPEPLTMVSVILAVGGLAGYVRKRLRVEIFRAPGYKLPGDFSGSQ